MEATVRLRKDFLKEFMSEMDMSQEEMGHNLGFQQSHISRVLNGAVEPNARFIAKMMAAFEASFELFFYVEEEVAA